LPSADQCIVDLLMPCSIVLGGCKISSSSIGKESRIIKIILNARENM
jgi:hypothetical protein